jgi:hypothetical protein
MSLRDIRIGDTIIGADMATTYIVEVKSFDKVKARSTDPLRRLKTFRDEDVFCVDLDDGLWQELEQGSKSL